MGDSTNFCPFCQMPFKLLHKQNVNLHLEVCFRKKSPEVECPKGVKCDSSMRCHYGRYSHKLLANSRANNSFREEDDTLIATISSESQPDTESSSDEFQTTSITQHRKGFSPVQSTSRNVKRKTDASLNNCTVTNIALEKKFDNCKSNEVDLKYSTKLPSNDVMQKSENSSLEPPRKKSENCDHSFTSDVKNELATDFLGPLPLFSYDDQLESALSPQASLNGEETESSEFSTEVVAHDQNLMMNEVGAGVEYENVYHRSFVDLSFDVGACSTQLPNNCKPPQLGAKSPTSDCVNNSSNLCFDDKAYSSPFKSKGLTLRQANFMKSPNSSNTKQRDIRSMLFGMKSKVNQEAEPTPPWFPPAGKRQCPFYKKVNGTNFAIDAFSYGLIPRVNFYFLTHFHYDHYMGLTRKFTEDVYCSHVTGNLVELKLRLPAAQIKRLPMNEQLIVGSVSVTLLEANHCPGAVLLLFRLKNGQTVLHTGDFRADETLQNHPLFKNTIISTLYLDTTYLDHNYDFPTQGEVVRFVSSKVLEMVANNSKTLVVTGTYCIGKEKVFMAIANALDCKVCVTKDKFKILKCLNDDQINSVITQDTNSTNLHVLPMGQLSINSLYTYLSKFSSKYVQIVAIKPTGWTYSGAKGDLNNLRPIKSGPVTIYAVPYSEHSSFVELKTFVENLKPVKVIPTVNVARADQRKKMFDYLNKWKQR